MQEQWAELSEFDGFAVSNIGRVRNLKRDVILKPSRNGQGIAIVGLHKEGKHTTRSVPLLVAENFVHNERPEVFNAPIQLDGNRMNCHFTNLMWRPRWFAVKYHQQFWNEHFRFSTIPLLLKNTGEIFCGWMDPCVKYGLRYLDIIISYSNNCPVPFTGHYFDRLDN